MIGFEGGGRGLADWEGRNAGVIGIGAVHLEWMVADGGHRPKRRQSSDQNRRWSAVGDIVIMIIVAAG